MQSSGPAFHYFLLYLQHDRLQAYTFQHTDFLPNSTPCCRRAQCRPSCVTMRHSLAEAQASSMHVALDCLPPPGLAAPRHHAANAVAAAGPCPSPRASTTPAVTGPWRRPSAALPTLIRSPADRHSEADRKQRNADARAKEERERERTRWTEDETDVQVEQQNKGVSKICHRGGKRHRQGFGSSRHKCPVYTKTSSEEVSSALGGNKTLLLTPKYEQENFFLQQMQQMLTSVHRLNQFYPVKY